MPDSISEKFSLFKKPLKILFVAAEVHPYTTVGGLGMVIFSLSRALKKLGLDVRILMPKYGQIDEKKYKMEMVFEGLKVPTGEEAEEKKFLICNIKKHSPGWPDVPIYFLENMEHYEKRSNAYGYSDDPIRFTLLSRGVLEFLRKSNWTPNIIMNGLDYQVLNPASDKLIPFNFNIYSLKDRVKNKVHLQKEFNLEASPDIPLLGMVGRLSAQKGIDILMPILETLVTEFNIEFIIIGGGEGNYRSFFEEIGKKFPEKVGCHLMFDLALARHIFSGCDLFLMPSKFEPCGITQMEAMRYGAIPVVRTTGGLADTVRDFDPKRNSGNGFVFENYNPYAFFGAIVRALETYKHKKLWRGLMKRAMRADFSWDVSAKKYFELYKKALILIPRQ